MSEALKLKGKLDLSSAAQLVTDLKAVQGDVLIDASEVTSLGALGLQALIASARKATAGGHKFEISNVPERMTEQMNVMGMTPQQLMEGAV